MCDEDNRLARPRVAQLGQDVTLGDGIQRRRRVVRLLMLMNVRALVRRGYAVCDEHHVYVRQTRVKSGDLRRKALLLSICGRKGSI